MIKVEPLFCLHSMVHVLEILLIFSILQLALLNFNVALSLTNEQLYPLFLVAAADRWFHQLPCMAKKVGLLTSSKKQQ